MLIRINAFIFFFGFTSTFAFAGGTMAIDRANDKLDLCTETIRLKLAEMRKSYGDVHFECRAGVVNKLFVPLKAGLFDGPPEKYVMDNWSLFFKKKPVRNQEFNHQPEFDHAGNSTAQQTFRGIKIWNAVAYSRSPVRLDTENLYSALYSEVMDTSDWKLKTKYTMSCEDAKTRARAYEAGKGISLDGREYMCESTPYVIKHFCGKEPAIVFQVEAITRLKGANGIETKDEAIFPVEVQTGKACNSNWN